MNRLSLCFALPLFVFACAAQPSDDETTESLADEVTSSATYVRITGTCFQSYDMKAVNTGATLGAARLVFKPGEESKQFAFCAGTDRVILRGAKTDDGNFAVDSVWMQQSGETVAQNAELVRALKRESGETLELSLNGTQARRVSFQFGTQTLSTVATEQFAKGRVIFAGPKSGGGSGGYGQSAGATRKVEAVFQEME